MALNIKELIILADRLDKEGRHKEAAELDGMIQKLAAEWKDLGPDEQKGLIEQQDWHKDPVGYINRPEKDEEAKEDAKRVEEMTNPETLRAAQKHFDDFIAKLKADGVSAEVFFKLLGGSGGMVLERNPETDRFEYKKEATEAIPGVSEKTATWASGGKLPSWQPGAMDLADPSRLGGGREEMKEDINREMERFLENPDQEIAEGLKAKILQFIANKDEEADRVIAEELKEKDTNWDKWAQRKFVFEKLATIADRLDALGAPEEAGLIDGFIKKHAEEGDSDYQGEDDKSEQSKRYDSKHHHSLQIREPKTKQERIDREGREKHHVHTMQSVEATALSTRYCPDHLGIMVGRVGESTYQCPLDGAVYNWETGWTDFDGKEHPGGSVAGQTPNSSSYETSHRLFDSRENTLNRIT